MPAFQGIAGTGQTTIDSVSLEDTDLSSPEGNVYRVTECWVQVAGKKLPVAAWTLSLAHNSIPAMRVIIDPLHTYGADIVPATPASMTQFIERYQELQEASQDEAKRKSNFTCKIESENGDKQEVVLTDWLLVGAGFAGLNAHGAIMASLELEHPAGETNDSSVNLFGSAKQATDKQDVIEADNLYDGLVEAMTKYVELARQEVPILKREKAYRFMVQRFEQALTAFKSYYEKDDNLTWPDQGFGALGAYIPYTLWQYMVAINDQSLWAWLSQTICSEFHASIIPTYWKPKLLLRPYAPWEEKKVVLNDYDVVDISLPPRDPSPVCGLYCMLDDVPLFEGTWLNHRDGMDWALADASLWVEEKLPGAIHGFKLPGWAWNMLLMESAYYGVSTEWSAEMDTRANMPGNATQSKGGLGKVDLGSAELLRAGADVVAKQMFTEEYRRTFQISLVCRFLLQTDGSEVDDRRVIPGYVYQLAGADLGDSGPPSQLGGGGGAIPIGGSSSGGSSALLRFYATQVVHTLDCMRRIASTQIIGAYLRQEGGPTNVEAIPGGVADNYMYGVGGGG